MAHCGLLNKQTLPAENVFVHVLLCVTVTLVMMMNEMTNQGKIEPKQVAITYLSKSKSNKP